MTNVLVVEDDDLIRSVLVKALGGAEYTALEAVDGESAQAILSTISDIGKPNHRLAAPEHDRRHPPRARRPHPALRSRRRTPTPPPWTSS